MNIKLGYAVGTGEEVRIPVAHMVVTGQTQLSGKTTTLEALVHRASSMRALAFLTKRGEGALGDRAKLVPPYFRERADWKFVEAVLQAEVGERLKFERGWIMKACRGAHALRDVRKNVTKLMAKAREGLSKDVYMMLGEYLDAVIPVLDRVKFADSVYLRQGISVVDLAAIPLNVQGLVIASMLQWVHERERDVTVILPESWKFIPQGRNSPVRMAATSLAREGAGISNLLWLDSQDIAGAEKEILRQASVWLVGVQREANEIRRALGQMGHGIKKPSPTQVAQLRCGEFFACWGQNAVRTYVQPAWMDDETALRIARGEYDLQAIRTHAQPALTIPSGPGTWVPDEHKEDEMNAKQEEKLDRLVEAVTRLTYAIQDGKIGRPEALDSTVEERAAATRAVTRDSDPIGTIDVDALYRQFVERMRRDPVLIKIALSTPEIEVTDDRQVVEFPVSNIKGKICALVTAGWFKDGPKKVAAINKEIDRRHGGNTANVRVWEAMKELTKLGVFYAETDGYAAVDGVKVTVKKAA